MVPIIIQSHNRLEYTQHVISSINTNILYPHKIIIIDNASTDGTIEYLKFAKDHGFIDYLVFNSENKGIAEPKNQGIEIVKELSKSNKIDFVCISDNDIVPPFIRDGGCILEHIVRLMDKNPIIGMCGIDLNRDNAPDNQEWWWRLRQHNILMPTFAEISIGFWFAVIRITYFDDFKFSGESKYGKIDESIRNYITLVKKAKVGLIKGVLKPNSTECLSKCGIHLGWKEDAEKFKDYVAMKKQERYKAELAWKEKNRKW